MRPPDSLATSDSAGTERRHEFNSIVAHSLPRFKRIAMRWLRNSEDAEDAVQEAMLSAFRNITQFDRRAQMSTWLTAIVINAVRMQLRRRTRRTILSLDATQVSDDLSVADFVADSRPSPERDLEQQQLRELVSQLASRLPASQRSAVRLRIWNDLSIQDVASVQHVPVGTVKARLARARTELKKRVLKAVAKPQNRLFRGDQKSNCQLTHPPLSHTPRTSAAD